MAVAKKFEVEVTVPEGKVAGDTFIVSVEAPEVQGQARGKLNGIALEDMTDEQLKVELINANSVLYKATKRGASADLIAKCQARVDAAKALKASRTPAPTTQAIAAVVEGTTEETPVVDEDLAGEI